MGDLCYAGNGSELKPDKGANVERLIRHRLKTNGSVIAKLREDPHSASLHKSCVDDAALGRMTEPRPLQLAEATQYTLSPRFGVEQGGFCFVPSGTAYHILRACFTGVKADGSIKIRPIDDMRRSKVNAATCACEKLKCDTIDTLMETLRITAPAAPGEIGLFKADIDSAYRRVPLARGEREFAYVIYMLDGVPQVSGHLACPFGSTASVHNWDRIGSMLRAVARRILHIITLRYVDDFFGPDRLASISNAMEVFARLVRACLGEDSLSPNKLSCGNPLTILGVLTTVSRDGATFAPSPDKVEKWCTTIDRCIDERALESGLASKLSGQLQWGTQRLFKRAGRMMVKPIIDQIYSKSPRMRTELQLALRWWQEVLKLQIVELKLWEQDEREQMHLFCDARSKPPRLAAVLIGDGTIEFCDQEPDEAVLCNFRQRGDGQILSLELLSIALGVCSFAQRLEGRNVVIWSDNRGAEVATEKGATKNFDQGCVVHALWRRFLELRMGVWVMRVPTDDNIADEPSREHYDTLWRMKAKRVTPVLDETFQSPQAWESLSFARVRNLKRAVSPEG